MTQARRILMAQITHETHSFLPDPTTRADFRVRLGDELFAHRGDGGCIDAFLEIADREGWQMIPGAAYSAKPAGIIDNAVFEEFWTELNARLQAALAEAPIDGILLALHGAALTDVYDDLEGELFARLRAIPQLAEVPLSASFDLHANFTDAMASGANVLVGYRENPHTDIRLTSYRAAEGLARMLNEGVKARVYSRRAPLIWPPTGTGTADMPMEALCAEARRIEAEVPGVWYCNVIGGFSFSDVAEAGVAFSVVTTGDEAAAQKALDGLVALAIRDRALGIPDELSVDAALLEVKGKNGGPWMIVEPADNIGGGGPGDCTGILRGLVKHGVSNALLALCDPEAVAELADAEPGEKRLMKIGGKSNHQFDEGPVELEVTFVSRSDGKFELEDLHSHMAANGKYINMGNSAVVTAAPGITILLTSVKTSPNDRAQFRSQGIEPSQFSVIGVKGAVAWRQAYKDMWAGIYVTSAPGPTTSDLHSLPYQKLRRPIWPLDDLSEAELMQMAGLTA